MRRQIIKKNSSKRIMLKPFNNIYESQTPNSCSVSLNQIVTVMIEVYFLFIHKLLRGFIFRKIDLSGFVSKDLSEW